MAGVQRGAEHGDQVFRVLNVEVGQQHCGVLGLGAQNRLVAGPGAGHRGRALHRRHHRPRQQPAIPVNSLDVFALRLEAAAFAQLQAAVLADDVEDFAQHARQGRLETDRLGHAGQHLRPFHRPRHLRQLGQDDARALLQVAPERHRAAAGRQIGDALVEDGLEKHRQQDRAIPFALMLPPYDVPDQHRAHVGIAVGQLEETARNRPAAVQHLGHAAADDFGHGDDTVQRPHGRAQNAHQGIDAPLQAAHRGRLEHDVGSVFFFLGRRGIVWIHLFV